MCVMYCIKISDSILLENILAGARNVGGIDRIRFTDVEKFRIFLQNNLPGYVDCDVDMRSIHKLAKSSYGCSIEDGVIIPNPNKYIVRRSTLRTYPDDIANQILQLAGAFWKQHEEGQNIPRIKFVTVA